MPSLAEHVLHHHGSAEQIEQDDAGFASLSCPELHLALLAAVLREYWTSTDLDCHYHLQQHLHCYCSLCLRLDVQKELVCLLLRQVYRQSKFDLK